MNLTLEFRFLAQFVTTARGPVIATMGDGSKCSPSQEKSWCLEGTSVHLPSPSGGDAGDAKDAEDE